MITRLIDRNEIKIFILYIINSLNKPMKYEDINDVIVQDGIVSAIDFADCFADLLDAGNIKESRDGEDRYYELSGQGRIVVESLQNDIPKSVRSQGLKSAFRMMDFKERGSKISATYGLRDDGKYDLCCRIIDNKQLSLEIKIVVESSKQLELMMHNFDDRPEIMYRGVVALLCGDMEYLLSD
ncbi:MAG: DUF4364 family protein [Eubacteriales bacterium]